MEAEIEDRLPQNAQKCPWPSESGRIFSRASEWIMALPTLWFETCGTDFRLLASGVIRRSTSVDLSHQGCFNFMALLTAALEAKVGGQKIWDAKLKQNTCELYHTPAWKWGEASVSVCFHSGIEVLSWGHVSRHVNSVSVWEIENVCLQVAYVIC